jgi:hypothetical protein
MAAHHLAAQLHCPRIRKINRVRIWETATVDVPELIRALEPLIPPLPPDK